MLTHFPKVWKDLLAQLGFEQFTPVQKESFEPIRQGTDLLAVSSTGTGKTLAYLWPLLLGLKSHKAQQILLLAPNTELAGQLFDVTKTWAEPLGWTAQVLLSGSSQKRQIERLKKGPQIIIGTPGRILELIKLKKIKMMNVDTIVLDEFDQLFSEGQFQFVSKIIKHVPRDHQMIYLSATDKFDEKLLAPNTVKLDFRQGTEQPAIRHFYLKVARRERTELLRKLANIPDFRGLVFFNSLSDLGASEERLTFRQSNVLSLASDVNVKFRKVILEKFKNTEINLLLATDMIARGIDIDRLECVINYDLPHDAEIYTHRAGRTGRMGREGWVITLISQTEELKKLKKMAKVTAIHLKDQTFYTTSTEDS